MKAHPWVDEIVAVLDEAGRDLPLKEIRDLIEERGVVQRRNGRKTPYKDPDRSIMAALEQRSNPSDSENYRGGPKIFRKLRPGVWGLQRGESLSHADAAVLAKIRARNQAWSILLQNRLEMRSDL